MVPQYRDEVGERMPYHKDIKKSLLTPRNVSYVREYRLRRKTVVHEAPPDATQVIVREPKVITSGVEDTQHQVPRRDVATCTLVPCILLDNPMITNEIKKLDRRIVNLRYLGGIAFIINDYQQEVHCYLANSEYIIESTRMYNTGTPLNSQWSKCTDKTLFKSEWNISDWHRYLQSTWFRGCLIKLKTYENR